MKLAVTGKGGVGKTTLSAALATLHAAEGAPVVAVDADPDSNLAATLGFDHPESVQPIAAMSDLIAERTGAQPGTIGAVFSLNPKVDDIPEAYCPEHDGVRLLVMGGAHRVAGSGCLCPEHAFLRALMSHLIFGRDDVVIMDMEAGIEHLTRGTAMGVDALVVVVEPGRRSTETALRIRRLGDELGTDTIIAVGNKVRDESDRAFIAKELGDMEVAAYIPYGEEVISIGMGRAGIAEALSGRLGEEVRKLRDRLL